MSKFQFENLGCDKEKAKLVSVDYLFNRFDLMYKDDFEIIKTACGEKDLYIPIHQEGDALHLGLHLTELESDAREALVEYLFSSQKEIKRLCFSCTLTRPEKAGESTFYVLELPKTIEELRARMTTKSNYNMRRLKRIIGDELGGYTVNHYGHDDIPYEVIQKYFSMKSQTHITDYGDLGAKEYLDKYYITDAYTLSLGERVAAILFSCEQCENIYLENLTYDVELSRYSVGTVLYDEFVQCMIDKGKKAIMLGGGNLEYKKKYGSTAFEVFSGITYRNKFVWLIDRIKARILKK